ncbi:NRT1/ PTR family 2.13-like protein [Tanacetum coccineum]
MEFINHAHAAQGNGGNLGYIYMECTKNQSVSVHQHLLDGCGEFWPGGEPGTVEALLCAACKCHRNFHRKVAVGQPVVRIHKHNQMTGPTWFYLPSPSAFVPVRPSTVANNHGSSYKAKAKDKGEREPAEREVKLLTLIEGCTISLNPPVSAASGYNGDSIDKLFDEGGDAGQEHVIERDADVLEDTIFKDISKKLREDYYATASNIEGKSLTTICGLIPDGSSVSSGVTKPPVVVSLTPTSDDGPTDSVFGLNLRTCPPSLRFVISSDDSHHSGSCFEVNFFAGSPAADVPVITISLTTIVIADASAVPPPKLNEPAVSSDSFYDSQDLDSETLHRIYVPKWNVTNDFVLDDPAARQVCLGAEVRMRTKHTLEQKYRFEDKCPEQTSLLSERDAEIAHLKSLLFLKEAEAVEAIRLHGQLFIVEAADAAKGNELMDFKERNFALEGEKDALSEKVTTLESVAALKKTELVSLTAQVASLESGRDRIADQSSSLESAFELFKGRMEAMQDEQAMVLGNRVAELDALLLEMATHLDEEFYPRFLTAISGRRWILTHGLKLVLLKCLQSSKYCHALGHAIGCAVNIAKYIDAVNALGTVDFSLLSKLKSKKDASIVDLIDSLRLEGPLAEIPIAKDLQPSPTQLMLPIHRPKDNVPLSSKSLTGEASTFAAPATSKPITTLSTTFASSDVVPPLSISNDQVLDMEPHDEDPPIVTIEKEELDSSPE